MDWRALIYFARIKPLAAWSIGAVLIGMGVAVWQVGVVGLDMPLLILAAACAILMQYVAHPLNDVTDYAVDVRAAIAETGRVKPIVNGMVTVSEAKMLSAVLLATTLLLAAYIVFQRPIAFFFALFGFFALIGYNTAPLRLAYRPYSEYYLGIPTNAILVIAVAYIASGYLSSVAAVFGILHGFAASTFFVSMMSMDFPSDISHGKVTTVGRWPGFPWCTFFPTIGLVISGALITTILSGSMPGWGVLLVALITVAVFVSLILLGYSVDRVRIAYLRGENPSPAPVSGDLRLAQLYTSIGYAVALLAVLLAVGTYG
jgi:1,4-dihydroxy-2-naphthoate octaprenyltransferase